jgi:oxygen-independent coproporphyrinogen-3 oxidase
LRIPEEKIDKSIGVYVHIPFCSSKCPYCDFNSVEASPIPEARYVGCLKKELAAILEDGSVDLGARVLKSVYLGGGTPSTLSPSSIKEIICVIKDAFVHVEGIEVTIEANPGSVDRSRMAGFKDAGVNRISIGVQSFDDRVLKTLGRAHTSRSAREAVKDARETGFRNIGVDLIFAVPGQTGESWEATLKEAVALRPAHISLYNLTIERSTPFYGLYKAKRRAGVPGAIAPASQETEVEMYTTAVDLLKAAGYRHYEISNFALPGYSGVHNQGYWLGSDYIGLGSGAHSYLSMPDWGSRFWNEPDVEEYMRSVTASGRAVSGIEALSRAEAATERVMLGLRMLERGIDALELKRRFGETLDSAFKDWKMLESEGFVQTRAGTLLLTSKGVLVSDEIFATLA